MGIPGSPLRCVCVLGLAATLITGCGGGSLGAGSSSSGSSSSQVTVPNVVGETQTAATAAITSVGLVVGTVTVQSSNTVPAGSVIAENPAAGAQANRGATVNLTVSSGLAQSGGSAPPPLSGTNINLIFVVSDDLAYQASGDINSQTANLTDQGLNRSLQLGAYLQQSVLGWNNVTGIFALEPMTHLQTSGNFPDLVALETIQQFALLNNITLTINPGSGPSISANSFPINVSYAPAPVTLPGGVATPVIQCPSCQGLDFNDQDGDNEALVSSIVSAGAPGFYVFSAPWELASTLLANINRSYALNLSLPSSYAGPDSIYAISIPPSGSASLVSFDSDLNPPSSYPTLPSPVSSSNPCTATPFSIKVTGGVAGAVIPSGINTNETVYIIRHAEAHPESNWDDGNYICAGQWRALDLPNALRGKVSPQVVYSIDPAQVQMGTDSSSGRSNWSYVRPALTAEPYAIANNLPYYLAASVEVDGQEPPEPATQASDFFFTGGQFTSESLLISWEHLHIPTTVQALVSSYYPNGGAPTVPDWNGEDYDTIWTVTLDGQGNLTVNNNLCEGISSASLPTTCPAF
jgi:PASTA domain